MFTSKQEAYQSLRASRDVLNVHNGLVLPNYADQKKAVLGSRELSSSIVLNLNSINRSSGTYSQPNFILPTPIRAAYAISLRTAEVPVAWGNILTPLTITVTYGASTSYPLDITIPAGNWNYDYQAGEITYSQAASAPVTSYTDNLIYFILINFAGALDSISVNASTGVWTWLWDDSTVSVTTTSPDALNFFKISYQQTTTWLSSGPPDLSGVKIIAFSCSEFATQSYITTSALSQTYLCMAPVDVAYGDTIIHEQYLEQISYLQTGLTLSMLSLAIIDPTTNLVLPLQADWCCELKIYTGAPQAI